MLDFDKFGSKIFSHSLFAVAFLFLFQLVHVFIQLLTLKLTCQVFDTLGPYRVPDRS